MVLNTTEDNIQIIISIRMEYKKRLNYLNLGDTVVRLSSNQEVTYECAMDKVTLLGMFYGRSRVLLTEKKYIKINNWDNTVNVLENPNNPRFQRMHYFKPKKNNALF